MSWRIDPGFFRRSFRLLTIGFLTLAAWPAAAVTVDAADQQLARAWLDRHLAGEPPKDLPFSFVYDGKSSRELLPQKKFSRTEKKLEGGRERGAEGGTSPTAGHPWRGLPKSSKTSRWCPWILIFSGATWPHA
ncbi:MAG: hypothetical protein ACKODZ_11180 [Verrucomicrobiota bacterium]